MKRLLIIIISLIITIPVNAAFTKKDRGTAGAKFLKIGVGGRAVSMGEAYTALCDEVSAGYWNPAGLTQINRSALTAAHTMWFGGFNHDYLGLAYPLMKNNQVIAVNATSLSYDKITIVSTNETIQPSDAAIGVTYARSLGFLNAGMTVKSINQKLYNNSMTGIAGDAGILYRSPLDTVGIGFSALNIGQQIDGDPLPLSIRLGSMLRIGEPFVVACDIHAPVDDKPSIHVGSEYIMHITYQLSVSLRMGFKDTLIQEMGFASGVSGGLGIQWQDVSVDYAFVPYGDLGNTHRISFGYKFGQGKNARVQAHSDYIQARGMYKKGMFMDAMEMLASYKEQPSKGPQAARLEKAARKSVNLSLDPDTLYSQAYMLYEKEKYVQSYSLISEALKINPKHPKARKLRSEIKEKVIAIRDKKKTLVKQEREEHEKEIIQSLLEKGQRQISIKEYKNAIKTFEKALRYQPDNKKAENLMITAQNIFDNQKSKSPIKKPVDEPEKQAAEPEKAVDKKQAEQLYNEGIQLYTEGNVNLAVKKWKKAISLNPSHTKARNAIRRSGKM